MHITPLSHEQELANISLTNEFYDSDALDNLGQGFPNFLVMGTLWPFINSLVYPQNFSVIKHLLYKPKSSLEDKKKRKKRSSMQFGKDFVPEFD